MNLIDNLVYRAITKPYLKIFVLPYDGEYEKQIGPHTIYTYPRLSVKEWASHELMPNYAFLTATDNNIAIPEHICLDCAVIHNRNFQYEIGLKISQIYQIPLFVVEHEKPASRWEIKQTEVAGIRVYSSRELADSWKEESPIIIEYPGENLSSQWSKLFRERGCYFENLTN